MSSIRIACPECGRNLVLPDRSLLGRQASCPNCRHRFVLEEPAGPGMPSIVADDPPRATNESRRGGMPRWLPLAVTAGLAAVAVLVMLFAGGGDPDTEPAAAGDGAADPRSDAAATDGGRGGGPAAGRISAAADQAIGTIRVETTPPQAVLLVDNQRVRNAEGELQTTPCLVSLPRGSHGITVVRPGYLDQSRQIRVGAGEVDVVFEPARKGNSALIAAPWFEPAETGQPLPIAAVNDIGRQRDPWLDPEGLTLWFASDRPAGRGIYYATRTSPFHDFGPPQLVPVTRGRDWRASPSVSVGGLLVYAVPEKAQLWGAVQSDPLGPFDDKQPLVSSRKTTPAWTAAQVLGDGRQLYWVERTGTTAATWQASRASTDDGFGSRRRLELPGLRPCLSADGLRQYGFDGKRLVRWQRASLGDRFDHRAVVATLELDNYVDDALASQFSVSDDERWMVYCDDPRDGGRLFLVRLHDRPNRGPKVVGRPAPARQVVAKADPPPPRPKIDPKPPSKKSEPAEKPAEPKVQPLPLTAYRAKLGGLYATRDYAGATAHLAASAKNPALAEWSDELAWDAEELAHIRGFWKDVTMVLEAMQPGDMVRIGSVRLKFVKFDQGKLVAQGKAAPLARELKKMVASDLAAIVEGTLAADDTRSRLRLGVFLHYDLKGRGTSAARRLARAGAVGKVFLERLGQRLLSEARAEIARGRLDRSLPLMATLARTYPRSDAAGKLPALRAELYSLKPWTRLGSRQWQVEGSAWRAGPGRVDGALLVSPRAMPQFELTLEWKTEGETGQGGVYFRYPGTGATSGRALKVQLSSDFGVSADQFSTGALFAVTPPEVNAVKATGEWNRLKLRAVGEEVEVTINGRTVLKTTSSDPKIPPGGHVALDGASGGITYRKVLLVPLAGR